MRLVARAYPSRLICVDAAIERASLAASFFSSAEPIGAPGEAQQGGLHGGGRGALCEPVGSRLPSHVSETGRPAAGVPTAALGGTHGHRFRQGEPRTWTPKLSFNISPAPCFLINIWVQRTVQT